MLHGKFAIIHSIPLSLKYWLTTPSLPRITIQLTLSFTDLIKFKRVRDAPPQLSGE